MVWDRAFSNIQRRRERSAHYSDGVFTLWFPEIDIILVLEIAQFCAADNF